MIKKNPVIKNNPDLITELNKMKLYGDFKIVPYSVYIKDKEDGEIANDYIEKSIKILQNILLFMQEIHNKININLAYIQYNTLNAPPNKDKKMIIYRQEIELYENLLEEIQMFSRLGIKIFAVFYKIYIGNYLTILK